MARWVGVALLACGAFGSVGCRREAAPAAILSTTSPEVAVPGFGIVEVPPPTLADAEATVRDHVRAAEAGRLSFFATNSLPSARSEAWGTLGMVYFAYDLIDAAGSCFTNAVALQPGDARAWFGLAECRLESSDTAGAIQAMTEALKRIDSAADPDVADRVAALGFLGDLHERQGDIELAKTCFNRVLAASPGDGFALVKLGQLFAISGESQAALSYLLDSVKRYPRNRELRSLLSGTLRKLGQEREADEWMAGIESLAQSETIQRPDPWRSAAAALCRSSAGFNRRGLAAQKRGRHREAIHWFSQALAGDPNYRSARINQAISRLALGEYAVARTEFEALQKSDPNRDEVRAGLALALAHTGQAAAATEFTETWVRDRPNYLPALSARAQVGMVTGDYAASARVFTSLRTLTPGEVSGPIGLAAAQAAMGDAAAARATLEAASLQFSDRIEVRHNLARLLVASRSPDVLDPARGLELAEKCWREAPTLPRAETWALALAAVGRWEEASKAIREANPGNDRLGDSPAGRRLAKVQGSIEGRTRFSEPWPFAE